MAIIPTDLRLSDLDPGDRFILLRTGEKYLLKEKTTVRYFVKPIGHFNGVVTCQGKPTNTTATLHRNCKVELI